MKREGWVFASATIDSEIWVRYGAVDEQPRFFTLGSQYFGPDTAEKGNDYSTVLDLAIVLARRDSEIITQLLDYTLEIYAELEDVVQRVSSYGGAGGLSVNEVLPEVFEGKLKWAIDDADRFSSCWKSDGVV